LVRFQERAMEIVFRNKPVNLVASRFRGNPSRSSL